MTTSVMVVMPRPNQTGHRVRVSVVQTYEHGEEEVVKSEVLEHGQSTHLPMYVYSGRYLKVEEV